ncbi:unnamed protein product [Pieris macdunnoughi]|uniref:DDE-1 domain-containing protein n=1 Tax=Pieris macdunnoughi TaxID=345717 RepID=A0A821PKD2_9NEOP|nr:unnamed protein product [Pieris macdunnoughi]
MVRNYKRKKEKAYTRDMLLEAVKLVKQKKLNSYAAAERFNIPRSTIISHVYATRGQKQINPGKDTVFSRSFEQEISSYLKIMEKNGFALTTKEVKALVSEYVKRNGLITPFKEDIPGDEWLRGFRKRNGLSIKKPQSVEMARKRACNPYTVYEYFDLLEDVLNDLDLTVKPERIYNLDETSFCNDPSKTRVIGEKGVRCTRTTSSPGRDNTTVLLATNAVGDKVPPLIIFQGKHLWNEWCYKDQTVKTAYTVSQKGWMETSVFEKYFKSVFLPAIGNDRPVLVICGTPLRDYV